MRKWIFDHIFTAEHVGYWSLIIRRFGVSSVLEGTLEEGDDVRLVVGVIQSVGPGHSGNWGDRR